MDVAQWAEIHRLRKVERASIAEIARSVHCCQRTVKKALDMDRPPDRARRARRGSILDPHKPKIDALIDKYPDLSAVRVLEELRRAPNRYPGEITLIRAYLRTIRKARGRVYQDVLHEPGQAMQVDWGDCGRLRVGTTWRRVSVFVAVLCYSRLSYIEFSLSQRKAAFYRAIANAIEFFRGSPRRIVFDNLRAAVISGSGRRACLHPEFLALCGHFCMEPVACERRDPESKGISEATVRYVKHNALKGRADELTSWEDYLRFAVYWRDEVANVRLHRITGGRPIDRYEQEKSQLRPLPDVPLDTDEVASAVVSPHARIEFDGNRYSVPPQYHRKTVLVRASVTEVRVMFQGQQIACHRRSYERGQWVRHPEHELAAIKMRSRARRNHVQETFDSLGEDARRFHMELSRRPVSMSSSVCFGPRWSVMTVVIMYGHMPTFTSVVPNVA
jgi:transposase